MSNPLLACLAAGSIGLTLVSGCGRGDAAAGSPDPSSPVAVAVSIPPLQGLVRPLAEAVGGEIAVVVPVGASEHGYEMSPRAVAAVAKADVVVVVGMGLDAKIEEVAGRGGRARVVQFAAVVDGEAEAAEHDDGDDGHDHAEEDHEDHDGHVHDDHDHGDHEHEHHGHAHGSGDPHLWLNPAHARDLVLAAKEAIEAAAREKDGWSEEMHARLEEAAAELVRRIEEVDGRYRAALGEGEGSPVKTFVVAHDAWGHLAERYGLETVAIAGLAGGEPRPEAISRAVQVIQENGLRAVYREPQMSDAACRRVAEAVSRETGREVKVLVLDPLGDGDWFAMMEANLAALKEGLGVGAENGDSGEAAESEG